MAGPANDDDDEMVIDCDEGPVAKKRKVAPVKRRSAADELLASYMLPDGAAVVVVDGVETLGLVLNKNLPRCVYSSVGCTLCRVANPNKLNLMVDWELSRSLAV